ncbi:hypothetical protein [Flavobacterium sp. N1994]|uniref:hypothetical protein n=1 Tax=Flavobacterium sp. N1994 TaxID=2986827 RepID=UPI0022231DC3|nr:hypothetical protein [Flavobacterium sp. N1994]
MKTITLKDALKLFLFLLILCSAKAFSFTRLPNESSLGSSESKFGCSSKVEKNQKTTSTSYSKASKTNAMEYKSKRFKK